MSDQQQYKWQSVPNDNIMVVHTRFKLPRVVFDFDLDRVESGALRMLLKTIRAVHGVEEVRSGYYEITVQKGEMFLWAEIVPAVDKAIQGFISNNQKVQP